MSLLKEIKFSPKYTPAVNMSVIFKLKSTLVDHLTFAVFFCGAGLLFHGSFYPVQEERGDGRPSGAVRRIREARVCRRGPQRHDEGRMN